MNDKKHVSIKNVITFDNGYPLSLFCNPDMVEVEDIKKTSKVFRVTYKCWISKMQPGEVWFDRNAFANILDLQTV